MEHKEENLQEEQGSMQRQTQLKEQFNETGEQKKNTEGTGVIPASEVKGSDADRDRSGDPSLKELDTNEDKYTQSERPRRSSWNSITFDNDDFVSGLMPV